MSAPDRPLDDSARTSASTDAVLAEAEARLRLADTRQVEASLRHVFVAPDGDARTRARAWTATILLESLRSRFDFALKASREAIAAWRAVGHPDEAIRARALGARALLSLGSSEDAMAEASAALADAQQAGPGHALMHATLTVGHICYGVQRFDEAQLHFERALQMALAMDDRVVEGSLMDAIACVHGSRTALPTVSSDPAEKRRLLTEAIGLWDRASLIARETGHRRNEAAATANQAEALVLLDRGEEALALLRRWTFDPQRDLARISWHLRDTEGVVCLHLGRHADAIALFTEALDYADGSAQKTSACEHLSDAYERSGDTASALTWHKRFHRLYKQVASEAAQRSASVAAIRLATVEAKAEAVEQRDRAERLEASNDRLTRRADDLLQQSLEDPLTGLANRRMMDRLIAGDAQDFAVAMIDVDHFKRINDRWSHAVGDDVLRRLAMLIRGCCRTFDTPIRCGGEEFALLLRYPNADGALATAERLRRIVETFDWTTIAAGLAVTISAGVGSADEAAATVDVMALADRRLYEAKNAGRNRVVGAVAGDGVAGDGVNGPPGVTTDR